MTIAGRQQGEAPVASVPPATGEVGTVPKPSVTPAQAPVAPSDEVTDVPSQAAQPYAPGVALVTVREGVTAGEVAAALGRSSVTATHEVSDAEVASGLVRVELAPGVSVADAVDELSEAGGAVLGAQPDYAYQVLDAQGSAGDLRRVLDATESGSPEGDALRPSATSATDPRATSQWALASLRACEAWEVATADAPAFGPAVTVAVLDAGFDIAHEDLAANVVAPYNAHTGATTAAALAGLSHGTHVAGIVSAVTDNAVGVAGVTHNARVMPIKVTDELGVAHTSDLVRAYGYLMGRASAHNVRVVNLSLGGVGASFRSDDAFLCAIDRAHAAGIVTVAAAGNASTYATVPYDCYPADHHNVVSVMNLRRAGMAVSLAPSSNRNAADEADKNICAPGTSIISTLPGNAYGSMTGTSMAAPYVAGVVALEFAANPGLGADDATRILYESACDLGDAGFDATYGYGEADAAGAVTAARKAAGGDADAHWDDAGEAARRAEEEALARRAADEEAAARAQALAGARDLIAALPDARLLSLADRARVEAARAAYDALAEDLRQSVDASRLAAAEQALARLEGQARQEQAPDVSYVVRTQLFGWQLGASNGVTAGMIGGGIFGQLGSLRIALGGQVPTGSVQYRTYAQGAGWQRWVADGALSGAADGSRGISALQVRLTGALALRYDVCYRTHSRGTGWTGWVRNGATAGRTGAQAPYQLDAIQVKVEKRSQ